MRINAINRAFSTSGKKTNPYDRGASRFRPQENMGKPGATNNSEPLFIKRSDIEKKLYKSRMKTWLLQSVFGPTKAILADPQFLIRVFGLSIFLYVLANMARERHDQGIELKQAVHTAGEDPLANKFSLTLGKEKQLEAILKQIKEREDRK